jgi:hypothetical protein
MLRFETQNFKINITMKKEQKQQLTTDESNVLYTLLSAGYSSFEVCFTAKLKRKGIMLWLEKNGLIKEKKEGFAVMARNLDEVDYITSVEKNSVCLLENLKVNGLR